MLDCYVNVHELARWFKIIIDFPEAWRLLTVRKAVFLIAETELKRENDGTFAVLNRQRCEGCSHSRGVVLT